MVKLIHEYGGSMNRRSILVFSLIGVILVSIIVFAWVRYGWLPAVSVLSGAAGWILAGWLYRRNQRQNHNISIVQRNTKSELANNKLLLQAAENQVSTDRRRIEALLRLFHSLAQVGVSQSDPLEEERIFMDSALSILKDLVSASGCSFVPVDEWRQPLPAFTYGELPEPVLRAWAAHLADGMLRERCGSCRVFTPTPGGCPLHPEQVGNLLTVICIPLTLELQKKHIGSVSPEEASSPEKRVVGVLHLYMHASVALDSSDRSFVVLLLQQIALGYESIHLRAKEAAALRQIKLVHASENDVSVSLGKLIKGLQEVLDADCISISLRRMPDENIADLVSQTGDSQLIEPLISHIKDRVFAGESISSKPGDLPIWFALPVALPDSRVVGMLLTFSNRPPEFHSRQKTMMQAIAAQAALLIENDRLIRSIEYEVVVQERSRLAREIHDGLAQTLAYLKILSGQMQTYLSQGDYPRLSHVLKENYEALAEAYLDTRQAIDNLRIKPQESMLGWLEHTLYDFKTAAAVEIDLIIEPGVEKRSQSIPLEIQAQLIRIVQETLSNVRKHAQATRVSIGVREWGGDLIVEICDDGIGFDADDVPEISRHGLRGMRERADLIGADFQIISQKHMGTTIRLVLPSSLGQGASK